MTFLPAEKLCLSIVVLLAIIDGSLIALWGVSVDAAGYAPLIGIGVGTILVGQFYRVIRKDERLALAAIAVGIFVLFTLTGSILNYLLLPIQFPVIDGALARADAMLGFSWPSLIHWVADFPSFSAVLNFVYFTSLPQMTIVILVLSFVGDDRALHRFLVTGLLGALLAMLFWTFWPSFGTSAYYVLPEELVQRAQLAVTPAYGAELKRLAQDGVALLSPRDTLGLIAFPSFHTVMACMSVWFMTRSAVLLVPTLLLNILMVPAIIIHGGHHLVDVFGGVLAFALAFALSGVLLRSLDAGSLTRPSASELRVR